MKRITWFSSLVLIGVAGVVVVGVMPARAALTLETSRAALAGTDNLDWGDLGPNLTFVPQPFMITSDDGLIVTVSKALAGDFQRLNQGVGWNGNSPPATNCCGRRTVSPRPAIRSPSTLVAPCWRHSVCRSSPIEMAPSRRRSRRWILWVASWAHFPWPALPVVAATTARSSSAS